MRLRFVLALLLALLFITSHFSTLISYASHASVHGCAPLIPPSVTGSPIPAPATPGKLLINEVLSLPGSRWNCSEPQNTYSITNDSWIELYNPQNQAYNLYVSHATFEIGNSAKPFYLPLGSVIAPHGYLVLFLSTFSGTFISSNIRLLIQGITIDQINIPSLPIDQSYARIPDGSISWQITNTPTIDTSNNTSQPALSISPTITSSHSSNKNSANQVYSTSTPAPISGTQTIWSNLQFPTPVSIKTPIANPRAVYTSSSLTPVNDGWDTLRHILITTLLILLALILFWCWKLFTNS